MKTKSVSRVYYLDWLRMVGILAVFLFHSLYFFNTWDWHVKSPLTYFQVNVFQEFLMTWMMPLMFLISGMSIYYAMRKGDTLKFFKDKFLRLVVPLLVGVFTHASLQVYLERITHHQFYGSYFQFLPHYFHGWYMDVGVGGNFAWTGMHLWYLLFLFLYTVLLYPLFRWLKGSGQRVLNGLGNILAVPGLAYLLWLPTLIFFDRVEGILGDPGGWPILVYILFLFMGFVIASHPRLQTTILRMRWISLVGTVLLLVVHLALMSRPSTWALFDDLNSVLASAIVWFALQAFLGFGMKYLNHTTPLLSYANEAVLPFYILHQTVLLCIGFFVVRWAIPAWLMWLTITPVSFILIMVFYEFLVRRTNILRFLFGMKTLPKAATLPVSEPALASGKTG